MPSSVRPKGTGAGTRGPSGTPMSERQQMALLMQMTSSGNQSGSQSPSSSSNTRNRDRNERGETPLHLAAIKGDVEQVNRLLAHRSDPNVSDFAGWTPLHEACNHGWYEVGYCLVQAGANVNARGLDEDTPLHDAASNGHVRLVKMLVERGADIHVKNRRGKSPCDVAAPGVGPYLLNPNLPYIESNVTPRIQPRLRDDKKQQQPTQPAPDAKKCQSPENMENLPVQPKSASAEDEYTFNPDQNPQTETKNPESNSDNAENPQDAPGAVTTHSENDSVNSKRGFSEMESNNPEEPVSNVEEENRRKKRKDSKDEKPESKGAGPNARAAGVGGKGLAKPAGAVKGATLTAMKVGVDRKSPCPSPKPAGSSQGEVDADDVKWSSDLKVPPLKIVIPQPQQTGAAEQDPAGGNRNGKSSSQRGHHQPCLPYVVPSSGAAGDSVVATGADKDVNSGTASPTDQPVTDSSAAVTTSTKDDKKDPNAPTNPTPPPNTNFENEKNPISSSSSHNHQRVLRSSHKSGSASINTSASNILDRNSNNSSPSLQNPAVRSQSPVQNLSPANNTAGAVNSTGGLSCPSVAGTQNVSSAGNGNGAGSGNGGSGGSNTGAPSSVAVAKETGALDVKAAGADVAPPVEKTSGAGGTGLPGNAGVAPPAGKTGGASATDGPASSVNEPEQQPSNNVATTASNPINPVTTTQSTTTTTSAFTTTLTTNLPSQNQSSQSSGSGSSSSSSSTSVDLHPRKRKMRPKDNNGSGGDQRQHQHHEAGDVTVGHQGEVHPHEQPITNCYQLYLNIRKQIERRRRSLFPVQPKPPQGFKDYMMNRRTYVLAGDAGIKVPNVTPPATMPAQMKELFTDQEKERYRLRMQHVIEKEKLVLSVEQEILRVHGRAARALANQSLPFSVCTVLRDEEVYNIITPEQEEKDRNARSRYNGRLFLSWLQDVDDKWEKIKESMLLRHHNEAESLHAVQKMDWEWKLKELMLCDYKATPVIDDLFVPMVHVSDDFDLLPA